MEINIETILIPAMVAAIVAIIGHWISRKNARLTAEIARENSILSAQISRENAKLNAFLEVEKKIAESRQIWINDMRNDMSLFSSLCASRSTDMDNGSDDNFSQLIMISSRIEMRMNPKDENYENLLSLINKCLSKKEIDENAMAVRDFVDLSQKVLKQEWNKLKEELRMLTLVTNKSED